MPVQSASCAVWSRPKGSAEAIRPSPPAIATKPESLNKNWVFTIQTSPETQPRFLDESVAAQYLKSQMALREILTAPDPRGLAQKAISEGLNVREIERLAQIAKDEKHGPRVSTGASTDGKSADTRALEQSLSDALGLEIRIAEKGGAGELRISYKTLDQLDDVIRRLRGGL